ncbi:hypothetical protein YB2330_000772 [Saitoella coloradoensis]
MSKPSTANIANPPGFVAITQLPSSKTNKNAVANKQSTEDRDTLKVKKAWEIALAPAKNVPMQAFMMYMSGSSLQIFSLMMAFMLFKNPVTALSNTTNTFLPLESEQLKKDGRLWLPKVCFVVMQVLMMGLGVYKCWTMGLLPTSGSDRLVWAERRGSDLLSIFASS